MELVTFRAIVEAAVTAAFFAAADTTPSLLATLLVLMSFGLIITLLALLPLLDKELLEPLKEVIEEAVGGLDTLTLLLLFEEWLAPLA